MYIYIYIYISQKKHRLTNLLFLRFSNRLNNNNNNNKIKRNNRKKMFNIWGYFVRKERERDHWLANQPDITYILNIMFMMYLPLPVLLMFSSMIIIILIIMVCWFNVN